MLHALSTILLFLVPTYKWFWASVSIHYAAPVRINVLKMTQCAYFLYVFMKQKPLKNKNQKRTFIIMVKHISYFTKFFSSFVVWGAKKAHCSLESFFFHFKLSQSTADLHWIHSLFLNTIQWVIYIALSLYNSSFLRPIHTNVFYVNVNATTSSSCNKKTSQCSHKWTG